MVHVFKTSIETDEDIKKIKPKLDSLPTILRWNFDLEDCDNILRVEAPNVLSTEIIDLLVESNFECQELD